MRVLIGLAVVFSQVWFPNGPAFAQGSVSTLRIVGVVQSKCAVAPDRTGAVCTSLAADAAGLPGKSDQSGRKPIITRKVRSDGIVEITVAAPI